MESTGACKLSTCVFHMRLFAVICYCCALIEEYSRAFKSMHSSGTWLWHLPSIGVKNYFLPTDLLFYRKERQVKHKVMRERWELKQMYCCNSKFMVSVSLSISIKESCKNTERRAGRWLQTKIFLSSLTTMCHRWSFASREHRTLRDVLRISEPKRKYLGTGGNCKIKSLNYY
jgi:hypothetical protein